MARKVTENKKKMDTSRWRILNSGWRRLTLLKGSFRNHYSKISNQFSISWVYFLITQRYGVQCAPKLHNQFYKFMLMRVIWSDLKYSIVYISIGDRQMFIFIAN